MIKRIAREITHSLLKNEEPGSERFDFYEYGAEITLSTLINVILITAAGALLSDVISGAVFLAVFLSLRAFVGGYHTKFYFIYSAIFLLTYLAVYYINSAAAFIDEGLFSMILTVLILLGIIPIIAFAPVHSKPLSEKQSRICRIVGIVVFILISITALALHYGSIKYGSLMILTLASVSVLILIEIFKRGRKTQ